MATVAVRPANGRAPTSFVPTSYETSSSSSSMSVVRIRNRSTRSRSVHCAACAAAKAGSRSRLGSRVTSAISASGNPAVRNHRMRHPVAT